MTAKRCYIGLAATYHDPAVAILDPEGNVVFAEATERYLQNKRAFNCPPDLLTRMPGLIDAHCDPSAELVIAVSWERGYIHPMRLFTEASHLAGRVTGGCGEDDYTWPWPTAQNQMQAMTASISMAGYNILGNRALGRRAKIRYYDHHLTHAATACYTSPFAEGACAILDGHGGKGSTAFYHYKDGALCDVKRPLYDGVDMGSLGQFYALVCGLCGFDSIQGEEWKVMGLASYGKRSEAWYRMLRPLLRVRGLSLVQRTGGAYLEALRGLRAKARRPGEPALAYADLAATGQEIFCELSAELLTRFHRKGLSDQLVLGGGCALNSSWNGRITTETPFRRLHVPMAPGDDGNALGAALLAFFEDHPDARGWTRPRSPYLGSTLAGASLENWVRFGGQGRVQHLPEGPHERVADLLSAGKIVGWARGKAELGPRALGNRSILADPRPADMADVVNEKVKFREAFRPFAPAVLHEHGPAWFEGYESSPYMERTLRFQAHAKDRVPAVVHADGTGRLQSVTADGAPDFYKLIQAFHARSGVPMVLNTSFNVMGKPIIHTVEDALGVFYTTGMDALVMEDYLLTK